MLDIVEKSPEVTLAHFGNDFTGIFSEANLKERGLADRVKSYGQRSDILDQLVNYDAFLCTSDNEGYAAALNQALMCGLAIVIRDVPGVRDSLHSRPSAFVLNLQSHAPLEGLHDSIQKQFEEFQVSKGWLRSYFAASRGVPELARIYHEIYRQKNA
jgi:glycosyltransferase involved in cell wall biosynthesis